MFWMTGQNRVSCRRSSATQASQRLGPRARSRRGEIFGMRDRGCRANIHMITYPISATGSAADPCLRPGLHRRGIIRSPPHSRKPNHPRSIDPVSLARVWSGRGRGGGLLPRSAVDGDPGETGVVSAASNLRFSRTSGSIVVGLPVQRPDADPGGHADLLVGREVPEVGRLQGVEPADLAALVADQRG